MSGPSLIFYDDQPLEPLLARAQRSIFLAGPTARGISRTPWRADAVDLLARHGYDGAVARTSASTRTALACPSTKRWRARWTPRSRGSDAGYGAALRTGRCTRACCGGALVAPTIAPRNNIARAETM
jgi:hypothetical protein